MRRPPPHDAPGAESSEPPLPAPQTPRAVFLPLLALLLLTLVTQLGSLPYIMGRAEQMPDATEHSFQFMAIATVVITFVLTILSRRVLAPSSRGANKVVQA